MAIDDFFTVVQQLHIPLADQLGNGVRIRPNYNACVFRNQAPEFIPVIILSAHRLQVLFEGCACIAGGSYKFSA
jgi:hypothetical protein